MQRNDPYYRKNLEQRISKDADQSEFDAILKGSTLLETGLYDEKVSGSLDDFETIQKFDLEPWHSQDIQLDDAVGDISGELIRRSEIMGEAYPFIISNSQIEYKKSTSNFYEFCLAISLSTNITRGENKCLPRIFERASAVIMEKFLGDNSGSIHVGSPRDKEVGSKFCDAMEIVHKVTNEWKWAPREPYPHDPTTTGDEGMDFIAWKNMPDSRKGKLFLVGQCACGDDWRGKFYDLTLDKIGKWFNPMAEIEPVRVFTVPHHLTNMNLTDAQISAGIVFDRARLCIIAEKNSGVFVKQKWYSDLLKLKNQIIRHS